MTSLQRWFDNQHPSDNDDYNAPEATAALPDTPNRFEVTLNDDHGAQYVETHQLATPPVAVLEKHEAAVLARLAPRARTLQSEEFLRAEAIVEVVVRKAQV